MDNKAHLKSTLENRFAMSKADYLSLAQQACEKERQREWDEARALWQKAHAHTTAGSQNENWAWARSVFCNVRRNDLSRRI